MSVVPSEIKHFKSANNPSNDTDTVGGATTTTEVGSSIGEIFHVRSANADEGDATKLQYKKSFVGNTNSTTALTSTKVYLKNALDDVGSSGLASAVSTSGSDDNTKKVHVVGEDGSGNVQTEDITLNGTSEQTGSLTFSKIFWIELQDVTSGALVNAAGDITCKVNSVSLGIIPTGYNCGLSIVDIGVVATLDDSGTTTNAVTAPGGISFSRPKDYAGGISFANGGSLTAGSEQGIWWKQTIEGGLVPAGELAVVMRIEGDTA